MDPTKSFDHLDPKLKETYARVMGTTSNGDAQNPNTTAAQPDQNIGATPTTFDPGAPLSDPNTPINIQTSDQGPNPGTGPTVNQMPNDASSILSNSVPVEQPPVDQNAAQQPAVAPAPDQNPPSSANSFFSNPSPAATDPQQPPLTPVTPYTPEDFNSNPQPLPSPASVNQQVEHKSSPLLKVLYIIGAFIFFAVYTIFWIKVFNLPFLF